MEVNGVRALLLVGSGGALGAILRYATYQLLHDATFPWATLTVNLIGSLLLSFLLFYVFMRHDYTDVLSLFLMMGVLGSFTTFSSFSMETVLLYVDKGALAAGLNVAANVVLCIAGAAAGRALALRLL